MGPRVEYEQTCFLIASTSPCALQFLHSQLMNWFRLFNQDLEIAKLLTTFK